MPDMTKPGKKLSKQHKDQPQYGRKISEHQVSLAELSDKYALGVGQLTRELAHLKANLLCDYHKLPANPDTKFKLMMYAPHEVAMREKKMRADDTEFARWVEARFGG